MKKLMAIILCLALLIACALEMTACGKDETSNEPEQGEFSILPAYGDDAYNQADVSAGDAANNYLRNGE